MGQIFSSSSESNFITLDIDNILEKIKNSDYKKKKIPGDYYITHYNGNSFIVLDNKEKKELKIFQEIIFSNLFANSETKKINKLLKEIKLSVNNFQSKYYLKVDDYCFIYNYAFPYSLTLFSDELKSDRTGYIFDEDRKFNNHFIKYNELFIGYDIYFRNEYIYKSNPLFGKGNTLLVQDKKNKPNEYTFIFGNNVNDKQIILDIGEKILYYYSPIGNSDVSDTIIITNKKIFCNSHGSFRKIPFSETGKTLTEIKKICSSKLKSPLDVMKYKYKNEFNELIDKIIYLGLYYK